MKIKRKMKKRVLSLLVATCLISAMMPATVFAEGTDTGKAIQLVDSGNPTGGISGYDSTKCYDYIYFGNWKAQDTHTSSGPIKWRVLDTKTNMEEAEEGGGLFLLSDALLGTGYNGDVYFDKTSPNSNAWQGSDAQAWCKDFAGIAGKSVTDAFSAAELSAILETTKSDEEFQSKSGGKWKFAAFENILNKDKVFFLSAEEAENSAYGFDKVDDRIAYCHGTENPKKWWLRSPFANTTYYAGAVNYYGNVDFTYVLSAWAARPAFNLNLDSVLFTSAAKGGKIPAADGGGNQSGEAAGAIFEIGDYDGNEWKLTLLDSSRSSFDADVNGQNSVSAGAGCSIEVSYSGAQTGSNEYVSVLLCDNNDTVLYYGNIAQNSENGTATLTLPSGLAAGNYTLKVFSEQRNVDKMTDYASAFQDISLTVTEYVAPSTPSGGGTVISKPTTSRISGDDRFETAVEVASQLKKELGVTKFNSIVVAYSDEFADALSASAFAQENEAPVLVINENNEEYVKKYIEQNLVKGGKVYIMGGNAVVTERFEESLSEYDVSRIGGDDRYETNLLTLKQLNLGGKDTIIIASGLDYADALSASSTGLPVMIVGDKLTDSQIAYLKTLGGDDTYYIAGGTAAVSSEVEKQLKDLNLGTIKRLAGGDRYETSVLIAETFYNKSTLAYLASGDDFPDGLTGGVLAGLSRDGKGASLLLVNERNTNLAASYIKDAGVRTVKGIGGTAAISDETLKAVI